MLKISILLSKKDYISAIFFYLINKTAFKIISLVLLVMILGSFIHWSISPASINIQYIITWFVLWGIYMMLIPYIIKKRASIIYDNTNFLQQEMVFEFSPDNIIWTTVLGTQNNKFSKIYQIKAVKNALILSFSMYQIIPLPYRYIPSAQWNQIVAIINKSYKRKITNHYFNKYNKEI